MKDKFDELRKEIMDCRTMTIINPFMKMVDLLQELAIGEVAKESLAKDEVQATLAEVKEKVDDLMDDGKLNQSNKKKTRKAKVKK